MFARGCVREHVKHELVVELNIADLDSDLVVETATDLRENLVDRTRDQASVLVVGCGATHCEGLTSTGLTVAHDCSIEAIDDLANGRAGTVLKDFLLGGVM